MKKKYWKKFQEGIKIRNQSFEIKKETPIVIYGASYIGSVTGKELQKKKYNVVGFIDKRAEEIEVCLGLPVYGLADLKTNLTEDVVIFVGTKEKRIHYKRRLRKNR